MSCRRPTQFVARVPEPGVTCSHDGPLDRRYRRHDRGNPLVAHPGVGDRRGLHGQHRGDRPHSDQFDPSTANNTASAATSRTRPTCPASKRKAVSNPAPTCGARSHYTVRWPTTGRVTPPVSPCGTRCPPASASSPPARAAGSHRPRHGDLDGGGSGERLVGGPDRQPRARSWSAARRPIPDDPPLGFELAQPRRQRRDLGRHAAAGRPRPLTRRSQPDPQRGRHRPRTP